MRIIEQVATLVMTTSLIAIAEPPAKAQLPPGSRSEAALSALAYIRNRTQSIISPAPAESVLVQSRSSPLLPSNLSPTERSASLRLLSDTLRVHFDDRASSTCDISGNTHHAQHARTECMLRFSQYYFEIDEPRVDGPLARTWVYAFWWNEDSRVGRVVLRNGWEVESVLENERWRARRVNRSRTG
jgi:hypothetical protein